MLLFDNFYMSAETNYHGISQFSTKIIKIIISKSKICCENHNNYHSKSKLKY